MYKKHIYSFLALGFVFLTVGCDKVCRTTVQDFAKVQNTTGREVTLNVCKGKIYGEAQAILAVDQTVRELSLGTHEGLDIQGGMDASKKCSTETKKMEMGIALSPTSFGTVKLCYNEISKLNVVVENHQSCPSDFLEQTSAEPCKK
jgi:hypothetical protein